MSADAPRDEVPVDLTLTATTFAVYARVPPDWFELDTVVREIAHALPHARSSVRKRLAHLHKLGLVEQRVGPTIGAPLEVRRRSL